MRSAGKERKEERERGGKSGVEVITEGGGRGTRWFQ